MEEEPSCAYEGCTNPVTDDDYCYGCNCYVCEEHDENGLLGKYHTVVEHWNEELEDDDYDNFV